MPLRASRLWSCRPVVYSFQGFIGQFVLQAVVKSYIINCKPRSGESARWE